ncbi:MAG: cytochrome c family protein [Planctomycetales bacterium]|nr:cytochrome c family protein [Planctomycetales bacterium]
MKIRHLGPKSRSGLRVILGISCLAILVSSAVSQSLGAEPLASPPEGQTYIGSKKCAACHFDQYLKWRQTKHAKGFEILPAKYQADTSCLACHSTGHGQDTGFKDIGTTPDLAGTSCEACHGPGSKHGEIAKGFGTAKLSGEDEAYVRSTIHLIIQGNACVKCHTANGHKDHPPYDK